MKNLFILLFGILLGFVFFGDSAVIPQKVSVSSLMDSTVALVDLESQHVYCSGVWIGTDQILTARHCVSDQSIITYLDYQDFTSGRFGVRLGQVVSSSFSDLALIKVIGEDHQHGMAGIFSGEIEPGLEVHIIGHPVGQVFSYMRGWVSAIRYRNGAYLLQVSAPVFLGNSGGGMFDGQGRLLGISSSMSLLAPSTGYFVSHREILEFLGSQEGSH